MTSTILVSEFYDLISPPHTANENIDIKNDAVVTVRTTTLPIGRVYADNATRGVTVTRGNEQTPIFLKTDGQQFGMQGTLRLDGGLITVGTGTGVAGQTITLPTDADGEGYAQLGGLVVEYNGVSSWWGYVDGLVDVFDDDRGKLFTQDTTANTVSFGSGGTSGAILPLGAVVKCANIQWKANGTTFALTNGDLVVTGAADINSVSTSLSGRVVASGWLSFSNPQSTLVFTEFNAHTVDKLCLSGPSSNNIRLTFGNGSYGDVMFVSDNDAGTEVVNDDRTRVDITTLTALFLNPKSNNNGRIRLNLNGGSIGTLNSYCGDNDYSIRVYNGVGTVGATGGVRYSCRSRPSQTGVRGFAYARGLTNSFIFKNVRKYGADASNEMYRFMDNSDCQGVTFEDLETPSDFICTRFMDVDFLAGVKITGSRINGTITDSTSRTLDMSSVTGTELIDVYFEDDDVDNQSGDFMKWFGVNLNGNIVNLGRSTPLAQTYAVPARTSGYVSTRPSLGITNTQVITGDVENVLDRKEGVYTLTTTEVIQWTTGIWKGVTAITGVVIDGSATSSIWGVQFRIRTARGDFSGAFLDYSTANVQAAFSALTEYDHTEGADTEFRVQRIGGSPSNRISNISLAVNYDPTYVFSAPGVDIQLSMPNILNGSQYLVLNTTKNTQPATGFATASGVLETFTEGLDFDDGDSGQVWVAYQSGTTVMEKVRVDFTFGTSDVVIPTTQSILTEYNASNGFKDGSTVDWLGLDPNNPSVLQFDASTSTLPTDSEGNAVAAKWDMVSWYYYAIANIPLGIQLFFDEMDIVDGANVRLNNGIKLDNVGDRQIYFNDPDKNLFTADNSAWTLGQMTGGYGVTATNKIPTTINVTSAFTPEQETSLALIASINSLVEEVHALKGLKPGNALTVTPTSMSTQDGAISLSLSGDGETSTVVERQTWA